MKKNGPGSPSRGRLREEGGEKGSRRRRSLRRGWGGWGGGGRGVGGGGGMCSTRPVLLLRELPWRRLLTNGPECLGAFPNSTVGSGAETETELKELFTCFVQH